MGMKVAVKLTEKQFQRQVIELAQLCGWRVAHFRPAMVRAEGGKVKYVTPVQADGKGFPDLVLAHAKRRQLVFAELKTDTRRTTFEQDMWLKALAAAGADVFCWRPADWSFIEAVLRG